MLQSETEQVRAGNVYEWCQDWCKGILTDPDSDIDPQGSATGLLPLPCGGDYEGFAEFARLVTGSSSHLREEPIT